MSKTTLLASDYVHLHNHTHYSLLDGLTKVPALVAGVKELGMNAVAVTDHGTLSGIIEFYKEANAEGINPILGMEAYVAARSMLDKEAGKDKVYYHLIILAMNNTGYQNLMRLSTEANLNGFYYKPRIDHDLLERYSEGLIVLSGCIGGEVADALRQEQYDKAKETAAWYKSVFGDRYYLEVQDHGHPDHPTRWDEQVKVNEQIFLLSKELDIPCVLTCDAHYLKHEDQDAHEVLLCVQTGSFLADEKRMSLKDMELHLTDPKELIARWGKTNPDIILNTSLISKRCHVDIELGKILIPKFDVPNGKSEQSYLEELVYQGLAWRYADIEEAKAYKMSIQEVKKLLSRPVSERVKFELGVISQMGFNGYFLIIQDFVNWGKEQGIVFGPGRGSAAGSIISYALRITELDPLKYDLLFERFLNPDRISMPDIDIDIQDSRRDEVIQYCVAKYGDSRVANIVTFGKMAARNAVRDVARVLQVPYAEADRLAKMIPPPVQGRHIPLHKSLQDDNDLKNEYESSEQSRTIFDLAVQLDGTIRSHGVHAAGVVIAPDDIVKFVPLEMAQKGVVATQYSMNPVEELGLLKMDFLGLSNLTIIKNTLRIIKKVYGVDIDVNALSLDDKKTFELLQKGDTTGVFQFESAGMKRYLKELKPTVFDDIIAMGALYRPGPLTAGLTQRFINRKNKIEPISFEDESMRSALESTYGVLVYQEQVMRIAQDMCGFTGGEADTLRKAIGKKKRDVMAKMKQQFIDGAITTSGVTKQLAEKFWKDLEGFADYAFNKSHSACYGMISFQTAYLKAHYPSAFMAALMTSDYDDTDRLAIEINECKHIGIDVLPPDVNQSFVEFAVVPETNQIRFGLSAIKNVGTGAVEEILRAREAGEFASLEDFFERVSTRVVNRKVLESLAKSGAFDVFHNRSFLLHNLDVLLAYANKEQKQKLSGQTDLFGAEDEVTVRPKLQLQEPTEEIPMREQLVWERELLGIYLSQHPLENYKEMLSELTVPLIDIKPEHDNKTVSVGGVILESKEITTKNGQKMAFVTIADTVSEIELILFPNIYQQTIGIWERDRVVLAKGKISAKDKEGNVTQELKILIDDAREITHEQATAYQPIGKTQKKPKAKKAVESTSKSTKPVSPKRIYIRMKSSGDTGLLMNIREIITTSPGSVEVVLVLGDDSDKQAIRLPQKTSDSSEVIESINAIVGSDNVRYM